MTQYRFLQLDVFTDHAFAGNPLDVKGGPRTVEEVRVGGPSVLVVKGEVIF